MPSDGRGASSTEAKLKESLNDESRVISRSRLAIALLNHGHTLEQACDLAEAELADVTVLVSAMEQAEPDGPTEISLYERAITEGWRRGFIEGFIQGFNEGFAQVGEALSQLPADTSVPWLGSARRDSTAYLLKRGFTEEEIREFSPE